MTTFDNRGSDLLKFRISESLLRDWDPIGVQQFSEAHDEYDGYVQGVFDILVSDRSKERLIKFLIWAEGENMGLVPDIPHIEEVATKLLSLPLDGE